MISVDWKILRDTNKVGDSITNDAKCLWMAQHFKGNQAWTYKVVVNNAKIRGKEKPQVHFQG